MVFPLGDLQRTQIIPWATYALIALNVMAYFLQIDRGDSFTTAYAATPFEITHHQDIDAPFVVEIPRGYGTEIEKLIPQAAVPFPVWMTMFTAMFLHASPMHLAGNMLYLWIFGDNVEEALGHVR